MSNRFNDSSVWWRENTFYKKGMLFFLRIKSKHQISWLNLTLVKLKPATRVLGSYVDVPQSGIHSKWHYGFMSHTHIPDRVFNNLKTSNYKSVRTTWHSPILLRTIFWWNARSGCLLIEIGITNHNDEWKIPWHCSFFLKKNYALHR